MGYTHYWRRAKEIAPDVWGRILEDCGKLILPLSDAGIQLADGMGERSPDIGPDFISINGRTNCGHPQNHEVSIPWPSSEASGLGRVGESGVDGSWFAGVTLETRTCNGSCDYETFYFPRVHHREPEPETGRIFDCCKTAFRPYDVAVTAFLLVAKHHMGHDLLP